MGLSGFYPKFVKRYVDLNSTIEKAVKKYSKEIKYKKFPKKKQNTYMENEIDYKINTIKKIKEKIKDYKKTLIQFYLF